MKSPDSEADRPPARWWEHYFDEAFIRLYEPLLPDEQTEREIAGIEQILGLPKGARVLDLGCGWGRHSIPLGLAGYRVTGVDLSEPLLDKARQDAARAGADVEWVRADVRQLRWTERFDAVISMFSSLGYWGSDTDDLHALQAAHAALRPGGLFLLETMHRDHVVAHYVERDWWDAEDGTRVWVDREWDPVRAISRERLSWMRDGGSGTKRHQIRVRSATEWRRILRRAQLHPLAWYGDWEGEGFDSSAEVLIVLCRAA